MEGAGVGGGAVDQGQGDQGDHQGGDHGQGEEEEEEEVAGRGLRLLTVQLPSFVCITAVVVTSNSHSMTYDVKHFKSISHF